MKRFFTIYGFELKSYINNKSFTITTLLLIVLLCAGTFLPRFIDMSDMLGLDKPEAPQVTIHPTTAVPPLTAPTKRTAPSVWWMKPVFLRTCPF